MRTEISVGLAEQRDGLQTGIQVAKTALQSLSPNDISLAMLFVSHPEPEAVLKGVNQVLPGVPLVGTTSMGEYTHEGYIEQGAGLMLIRSEQLLFNPMLRPRRWFGGKLLGKLQGISKDGLGGFRHRSLMLFPDNQSMNLDNLVQKAVSETAMLYDILGGPGLAPPDSSRQPAVFFNDRMIKVGMAGTELLSQQPIGMALANGWTPISGPYRVTRVDERRIVKIDGRPAEEVYEDFMIEHNIPYKPNKLAENLLQHPIGMCGNGDCKVSVVMGFDNSGAMLLTSPPPKGSLIHILATEKDAMFTAAQRAVNLAMDSLETRATSGALFIDCMSTCLVLGEAYEQQQRTVRQNLGDIPFLSFRSHGVLARLQGQTDGHFECSVGACLLPL